MGCGCQDGGREVAGAGGRELFEWRAPGVVIWVAPGPSARASLLFACEQSLPPRRPQPKRKRQAQLAKHASATCDLAHHNTQPGPS